MPKTQSRYHFDPVEVSDLLSSRLGRNSNKAYWHFFTVNGSPLFHGFFYTPEEAEALLIELENSTPNEDLYLSLGSILARTLDLSHHNPDWVNRHKKRVAAIVQADNALFSPDLEAVIDLCNRGGANHE